MKHWIVSLLNLPFKIDRYFMFENHFKKLAAFLFDFYLAQIHWTQKQKWFFKLFLIGYLINHKIIVCQLKFQDNRINSMYNFKWFTLALTVKHLYLIFQYLSIYLLFILFFYFYLVSFNMFADLHIFIRFIFILCIFVCLFVFSNTVYTSHWISTLLLKLQSAYIHIFYVFHFILFICSLNEFSIFTLYH